MQKRWTDTAKQALVAVACGVRVSCNRAEGASFAARMDIGYEDEHGRAVHGRTLAAQMGARCSGGTGGQCLLGVVWPHC